MSESEREYSAILTAVEGEALHCPVRPEADRSADFDAGDDGGLGMRGGVFVWLLAVLYDPRSTAISTRAFFSAERTCLLDQAASFASSAILLEGLI